MAATSVSTASRRMAKSKYIVLISLVLGLLLAGSLLASTTGAAQSKGNSNSGTNSDLLYYILVTIFLTGGFGGFIHGIMRQTVLHYRIRWPFAKSESQREFGFVGDILVGIAAGVTLFLVMDTVFLVNLQDLANSNNPHAWLKLIAIGVIGGYMGPGVLDTIAMAFSKKLAQDQVSLEEINSQLEKARAQLRTSEEVRELLALADAYRVWKEWPLAQENYDAAINLEPNNPGNYVRKSFLYAAQAEEEARNNRDPSPFYENAIRLTENAMQVDKSFGRAYYDRACYRNKAKKGSAQDILADLKVSIQLKEVHRKLAKFDPDLENLRNNEEFKKIVDTEPPKSQELSKTEKALVS